jgi:hypothetical protein
LSGPPVTARRCGAEEGLSLRIEAEIRNEALSGIPALNPRPLGTFPLSTKSNHRRNRNMNNSLLAVAGSALLVIGSLAMADDSMMNHGHMMSIIQQMDTNGDGKISKDEYMAYYEKMWIKMKKDENGMVDAKSMAMVGGMMQGNQSK